MKLKICPKCKAYNLTESCSKCSSKTENAHYKFLSLKDEKDIKED